LKKQNGLLPLLSAYLLLYSPLSSTDNPQRGNPCEFSMDEIILIKGGSVVTMDSQNSIVRADVLVRNGVIERIGDLGEPDSSATLINAKGCAVLPVFVQTHIHLCQTLFRGAADDLALIDWLKQRVWPMEASHNAE
jgi:5-methylthioadenosine/S-adenosylhomocysteine deaminase